jgi:quercetin dioxygenase-like cupin family protein
MKTLGKIPASTRSVILAACIMFAMVAGGLLSGNDHRGAAALQPDGTPVATVSAISNEVLVHASPAAAANPELALGRVTLLASAVLPPHYHPGTQIAVVVQGTLTYTVFSGTIELFRHGSASAEPEVIAAGETVEVRSGDALIETPGAIHQGRNIGVTPVVIYLSTLFPADSPRAVIVDATPVP